MYYCPSSGQTWRHITHAGGLGDDSCHAMVCDAAGRCWFGTQSHGVTVFNGKTWKTYGPADGPLGCHVNALAVSPTDGSVWIGTELGLTRWNPAADSWRTYTRSDGLPSDDISAVAIDEYGQVYAGTSASGLVIGSPRDKYGTWHLPKRWPDIPNVPGGTGIPSGQINSLLVASTGTVYVGTPFGLARSNNRGETFRFLRGSDWLDTLQGLPVERAKGSFNTNGHALAQDYVTTIGEGDNGWVWVGHWQRGIEAFDPQTGARLYPRTDDEAINGFITCLLPVRGGAMIEGTYGDGVTIAKPLGVSEPPDWSPGMPARMSAFPALPTPAAALAAAELDALRDRIARLPADKSPEGGGYLGEDWATGGDWVGRYGRQSAVLCAQGAPLDETFSWDPEYQVDLQIGGHLAEEDSLRRWLHWVRTEQTRCLYNPARGYRSQSDADDHAETMNMHWSGPGIWISFFVRPGVHRIGLYFVNKDGQDGDNRTRSYLVRLKPYRLMEVDAVNAPTLATCRVSNFWGGVYKSFVVRGPGQYLINVDKNGSFNTIISAVMIDKLTGKTTWRDQVPLPFMYGVRYDPPVPALPDVKDRSDAALAILAAWGLWQELDAAYEKPASWPLQQATRLLAYRAVVRSGGPPELQAYMRWKLCLWTDDDYATFDKVMASARQAAPPGAMISQVTDSAQASPPPAPGSPGETIFHQ